MAEVIKLNRDGATINLAATEIKQLDKLLNAPGIIISVDLDHLRRVIGHLTIGLEGKK